MNSADKITDKASKCWRAAWAAADRAQRRCDVFRYIKRVRRLPGKPMSHETLKQLGLV